MALITIRYNYIGPAADQISRYVPPPVTIINTSPVGGLDVEIDDSAQDDLDEFMKTMGLVRVTATSPLWTKYTKTFSDFAVSFLTNDIELFSLPAMGYIHSVVIKQSTSFGGGLLSAYTLSVGNAGNLVKYTPAFNVFQAPGNAVALVSAVAGTESFAAPTSIRIAATAIGGFLNSATQGSADIWVLSSTLPSL